MKVDMHFHLEEGPYSLRWLSRTVQALASTEFDLADQFGRSSLEYIEHVSNQLSSRMQQGCFSEEWLDRYLTTGRARGIQAFGVVDHLYRFRECRPYYEKHMLLDDSEIGKLQRKWLDQVCVASIADFVNFISEAKKTRPDLALGIEADFFEGGEEELRELLAGYEWDYIIGSVHFLEGWGFDNPETRSEFDHLDPLPTYAKYFELLRQACASGLFDIIAHPDNLKVFGFRPENEQELLSLYHSVAKEMIANGVATEVNTGLAYRYPIEESCPSPMFLSVIAEYHVPITLSSDSHFPDDIGTLLDEAAAAVTERGYTELTIFRERKPIKLAIGN
ncbi:PHP domain-containing protein [Paenibacillus sp. GCM10012307]|uniref:Histidinol-phosphatase n=1 Tax=Paenibacillus roseus TaxID=2798579 RepID=A0A934IYY0_9BACL|nr:PHP domain-containing protein [Paenibacillus roseus]MBJ6361801.1 histidinol phosphate phosphatase domain-containing protein [Paenibacillus roseus]